MIIIFFIDFMNGKSFFLSLREIEHFLYLFEIVWGLSSVGRASDLHSEGQEFDSPSLQLF